MRKYWQKFSVLAKSSSFMSIKQKRILLEFFIVSNFNFCTLLWIFLGGGVINKISNLYEILQSIVYNNMNSSFKDLLKTDNLHAVHQKSTQSLAMQSFKVIENPLNSIISVLLQTRKMTNNTMQSTGFASSFGLNSL